MVEQREKINFTFLIYKVLSCEFFDDLLYTWVWSEILIKRRILESQNSS